MTNEERAVIEAAEAWHAGRQWENGRTARTPSEWQVVCDTTDRLDAAVRALRESRQPRPRWSVTLEVPGRVNVVMFDGKETGLWSRSREAALQLAEILNRKAERAEPPTSEMK